MSASRTRSAKTSRAAGCFRFRVTASLPRPRSSMDTDMSSGPRRAVLSPPAPTYGELLRAESPPVSGFSTLMTRAPSPASSRVAYGPASAVVRSTTVRPASGRSGTGTLLWSQCRLPGGSDAHQRHLVAVPGEPGLQADRAGDLFDVV